MKAEVDVLGFPSLIVLMVSVDVKNLKLELKVEPNQTGIFGPFDSNRRLKNKKERRKKGEGKSTQQFSVDFSFCLNCLSL